MQELKIPAHLESRVEVADGLAIFRFALESDFLFEPGQYATLWLSHDGKMLARPYSVVSSSSEKRHLEFYLNLVREGNLTPSLWDSQVIDGLSRETPGTSAAITGPRGRFMLDRNDSRDLVFIASGTGVAPFVSMIRKLNEDYLSSRKNFGPRRIYLIHGVRYPTHLAYREEFERLAAETLQDPMRKLALIYLPTISRPFMDSTWKGLTGRAETIFELPSADKTTGFRDLNETIRSVLRTVVRPETHVVYVCGHPGTIDNIVNLFSLRGFRIDTDIKHERFYR
jgi:ferredoxin/flavodoxin---NADP+ reductase